MPYIKFFLKKIIFFINFLDLLKFLNSKITKNFIKRKNQMYIKTKTIADKKKQ